MSVHPTTRSETVATPLVIALLCACGFIVRIIAYAIVPGIAHPDEVFQHLEQAHRLVYGTGLVPWEYVIGIRSWLVPGALSAITWAAQKLGDDPIITSWAITVTMSLLFLPTIICAYLWGLRSGGRSAGLIAGTLSAFWFELVYYSVHPLADTIGGAAFVIGVFLLDRSMHIRQFRAVCLAGIVLGLAVVLRVQLSPAATVAALVFCRLQVKNGYIPLALGAAVPVLLAGLLDFVTWGMPFQSFVLYVWANHSMNVAAFFGVEAWYHFARLEISYWSILFPILAVTIIIGATRRPDLFMIGFAILATFSLVGHKEHRFIYPALPFAMTLAGIGTAEITNWLLKRLGRSGQRHQAALAGAGFWVLCSAGLALFGSFRPVWLAGTGAIAAARQVNADPAACGLAVYPAELWYASAGYAHMRPDIGLYGFGPGASQAEATGFDYIVAFTRGDFSNIGFSLVSSKAGSDLWRRDGSCAPGAAHPLQALAPAFMQNLNPGQATKQGQ